MGEYLDPDHILGNCVLPSTTCAYFHPDGMTLDEFSSQLESAARMRIKQGKFFESVALANHGPDEAGMWNVCSDFPISLQSLDKAWPRLKPMFQALADMVSTPAKVGNVDLLACNFAANKTGIDCLNLMESEVNAKFSASSDSTGNVANGGNWELERGGRNVANIYFHEEKLTDFTTLMAAHRGLSMYDDEPVISSVEDMQFLHDQEVAKKKGKGNGKGAGPAQKKGITLEDMQERLERNREIAEQTKGAGQTAPGPKRHSKQVHGQAAAFTGAEVERGPMAYEKRNMAQAKKKAPVRHKNAKQPAQQDEFV